MLFQDTPHGFDGKALINSESGNEETAKKSNSALDDADVGFGRYSISKSANNKELGRLSRRNENSIWCPVAVKCKRTNHPICGFDDKIGLAKFNDICHMLEVNCYWKYSKCILIFCCIFNFVINVVIVLI